MAKPDYHVFMPNDDGFWMKLGAAWVKQNIDGEDFISIKIDALPLQFDGSIILHAPREEGARPLAEKGAAGASRASKKRYHSKKGSRS